MKTTTKYSLKNVDKNSLDRWVEKYRKSSNFSIAFDGASGAIFYTQNFSKCFFFDFHSQMLTVDRKK